MPKSEVLSPRMLESPVLDSRQVRQSHCYEGVARGWNFERSERDGNVTGLDRGWQQTGGFPSPAQVLVDTSEAYESCRRSTAQQVALTLATFPSVGGCGNTQPGAQALTLTSFPLSPQAVSEGAQASLCATYAQLARNSVAS